MREVDVVRRWNPRGGILTWCSSRASTWSAEITSGDEECGNCYSCQAFDRLHAFLAMSWLCVRSHLNLLIVAGDELHCQAETEASGKLGVV